MLDLTPWLASAQDDAQVLQQLGRSGRLPLRDAGAATATRRPSGVWSPRMAGVKNDLDGPPSMGCDGLFPHSAVEYEWAYHGQLDRRIVGVTRVDHDVGFLRQDG